jgi:DNA-binding NtrC family response regulator
VTLTPEAEQLLVNYPWPGNVRELKNALHHALVLRSSDTLTAVSRSACRSRRTCRAALRRLHDGLNGMRSRPQRITPVGLLPAVAAAPAARGPSCRTAADAPSARRSSGSLVGLAVSQAARRPGRRDLSPPQAIRPV